MPIIALELVPTNKDGGEALAQKEVHKTKALLEKTGLLKTVNTILMPQIIPEEEDRPIPLKEKLDALQFCEIIARELPLSFILTQVTVFTPPHELEKRLLLFKQAGIRRIVFVGVPRVIGGREVVGPFPGQAVSMFKHIIPHRGVILIPTRAQEEERFLEKVNAGASFGLTQMLFSDRIVRFLKGLASHPYRPEIILSFGYVPKAELTTGLIQWLIHDPTLPEQHEIKWVKETAGLPFAEKKAKMVDLYKRVIAGAKETGFPLGLHLECPYGVAEPALECFATMLETASLD